MPTAAVTDVARSAPLVGRAVSGFEQIEPSQNVPYLLGGVGYRTRDGNDTARGITIIREIEAGYGGVVAQRPDIPALAATRCSSTALRESDSGGG